MSRFGNLEFESGDSERNENETVSKLNGDLQFFHKGEEAFAAGYFEEALRSYSKALEFNPGLAPAWTGQVRSLIELGEFAEARVWADKALASFPNEAELLAAKGVALARSGDLQGAISFSDAAVESRTNTPYIWLARGDVLLAKKENRAEFCFEKALAVAGRSSFALWFASRIQAFYRRFATALKFAQEALALDPGRAVLWIQAGECQLALGLPGPARNSFDQARELDANLVPREQINRAADSGILDKIRGRWRQWFAK
jgi:tetratricopeptide (TPR) repeat protein